MTFNEIVDCLSKTDKKIIGEMTALFEDIGHQVERFATKTGLKCKNGCGACCSTPEIETTVAEALPLAVHLWSQGSVHRILKSIQSNPIDSTCVFYQHDPADKTRGRCGIYAYRPGLCRLFGFAARRDKYGKQVLMTCKVIKDTQPQECQRTQEELQNGLEAPALTAHSSAVANIDPVHGQKLLPINQAIREAIEKIGYCIEEKLKQKLPAALE